MGRPRKEFDLEKVAKLAAMQCTDAEIAAFFDVHPSQITRRKASDAAFRNAIEKGREDGKMSLRRLQWRVAERGNTVMLIWLGKQYLGQTDKQTTELTGAGGKPIEAQVTVNDDPEHIAAVLDILRRAGLLAAANGAETPSQSPDAEA